MEADVKDAFYLSPAAKVVRRKAQIFCMKDIYD